MTAPLPGAMPFTRARDRAGRVPLAADTRLAGGLFVLVGAGFLLVTMLAASIAPGYDFHAAAISDLGVISQTALLFTALLVTIGVLDLAAGILVGRASGSRSIAAAAVVAGVGAAGAGLAPLDTGDLHALFALAAFVAFNVQAIALARWVGGSLGWLGVLAGALGLVYVGVMVVGDSGNPAVFGAIGHGGAERMIAYPAMLWLVALGGALLGRRALGAEPPASSGDLR